MATSRFSESEAGPMVQIILILRKSSLIGCFLPC
jgi:hypothetical protein